MNQEIKDEAIQQLEKDILFGFENAEELVESISEMFMMKMILMKTG